MKSPDIIAEGKYLRLVRQGSWEYVERCNSTGVVIVVAVTQHDELLFVEQQRPPVGGPVLEFPAGLAGDLAEEPGEPLAAAAQRELLEETGYQATKWREVFRGPSSAGLTDEEVVFFLATGATKIGPGGGDASEDIRVLKIPRTEVDGWLRTQLQAGKKIDARLPTGLYLLSQHQGGK